MEIYQPWGKLFTYSITYLNLIFIKIAYYFRYSVWFPGRFLAAETAIAGQCATSSARRHRMEVHRRFSVASADLSLGATAR